MPSLMVNTIYVFVWDQNDRKTGINAIRIRMQNDVRFRFNSSSPFFSFSFPFRYFCDSRRKQIKHWVTMNINANIVKNNEVGVEKTVDTHTATELWQSGKCICGFIRMFAFDIADVVVQCCQGRPKVNCMVCVWRKAEPKFIYLWQVEHDDRPNIIGDTHIRRILDERIGIVWVLVCVHGKWRTRPTQTETEEEKLWQSEQTNCYFLTI